MVSPDLGTGVCVCVCVLPRVGTQGLRVSSNLFTVTLPKRTETVKVGAGLKASLDISEYNLA